MRKPRKWLSPAAIDTRVSSTLEPAIEDPAPVLNQMHK